MNEYTFNISLSILNHLGRNLYRSFITVLGEAISNAWDADARNVRITIDRDKGMLIIEDDGQGMTEDDFQNKFLKIGYSKRKNNEYYTYSKKRFDNIDTNRYSESRLRRRSKKNFKTIST